ncbi:MAG TPA: hypothetical protein VF625_07675, partial [Longimicrobium sp.]
MRVNIWAAALLIGAAACGDAATNAGTDGDSETGLTGGRGQAGAPSTINPSTALANSAVRDCPQRCAFRLTAIEALHPVGTEALHVSEDAGIGFTDGRGQLLGWWSAAGGVKRYSIPTGFSNALPLGGNGWGQLVGNTGGYTVAWEPDGSAIVLSDRPYGPPLAGEARAINDNSVIVGVSGDRAFRTQYREGFRWLSATGSAANDVNFKGQVVGSSTVGGARLATLWAQDGTATNLGTLAGYPSSEAVAISETGIVVGVSSGKAGAFNQGWIWTTSGGLKALPNAFIPSDVNHWGEV